MIPSSDGGHLGCFHILTIVNSAENIGVQVSFLSCTFARMQPWKPGLAAGADGVLAGSWCKEVGGAPVAGIWELEHLWDNKQ